MKKWIRKANAFLLILVFILGILLEERTVTAATDSVIVITQKQLVYALSKDYISTITIKPQMATSFSVPKGSYAKDLIVYQTNTTLTNNGVFRSLHVVTASQTQINKALKIKNLSTLTISTSRSLKLALTGNHSGANLIVDAKKCTITNRATWNSILINNCDTWIEEAKGNIIVLNQTESDPSEGQEQHVHKYTESIIKEASCTMDGTKKFTCECGAAYIETIPATGHDEGIWYEQKATTSYNGIKVRACSKCGAILEHILIPKLTQEEASKTDDTNTVVDDSNTVIDNSKEVTDDTNTVNGNQLITITIDMGNGKTKDVVGYYDYDMAREVFEKLNELRASKGLKPLAWNYGMAPSADVRAAEVTVKFDHYRPNGEYCYYIYPTMSSENVPWDIQMQVM